MSVLLGPELDERPWPTLGPQIEQLLTDVSVFGPGSLQGEPYELDDEKRAALYRMYEVYPKGHQWAGRRRFKRVGISWRKGLAKTEFMAQVAFAELHPDGPVRCDGFDGRGNPVGRPVRAPYIPLLAVTVEQVEELAFGALYYLVTEGPDADLFDATLERIVRLSATGRADGKAVPLSNSPGARDGARTTFQGFDEPHRLFLPRARQAHETMVANLSKRVLEDPWGLYVGTAGEPGQGSIAEDLHKEAEKIAAGKVADPQLFYFHREAGPRHKDLTTVEKLIEAVTEATGPVGEYGPGQFHDIASQWDREGADTAFLERVWLNRWTRSGSQAFDVHQWTTELASKDLIEPGAFVTVGFDGARFRDATALVVTDIPTGRQRLWGLWERPDDVAEDDQWEVPEDEVTQSVKDIHATYEVWKGYADPPHWTETVGSWSGTYPDVWVEWWTNRLRAMAQAVRAYREGQRSGACTHEIGRKGFEEREKAFDRHIAAAGRHDTNLVDDDGQPLFVLRKIHKDRKFDGAMAGCLSWAARLDAIRAGAKPRPKTSALPRRIR